MMKQHVVPNKRDKLIQDFHAPAAEDAGGMASDGRGKLALVPNERCARPLWRTACREAHGAPMSEHELLEHICGVVQGSGYPFSRTLIVSYYVSLKTNP